MLQNSSIFNSEAKRDWRYLAVVAGVTGLLLFGAGVLSVIGMRYGVLTWHFSQLLQYQLDKLNKASTIDILLVGDSSLGNAIDARAWSRELHRPVLSLALTGTYGYGGSLNMIRRALRRSTPRTIIVFNTVKMMWREETGQGLLFTAERLSDLDLVRPAAIWRSLINLAMPVNVAGTMLTGRHDDSASYIATDYVPQSTPLSQIRTQPAVQTLQPTGFVVAHQRYLAAIGAICADHGIQCLYVHGPEGQWECQGSGAFIAAVNEIVRKSGLHPVARTPLCMDWADVGDAEDHVHPNAKAKFSAQYLSVVAPLLQSASR